MAEEKRPQEMAPRGSRADVGYVGDGEPMTDAMRDALESTRGLPEREPNPSPPTAPLPPANPNVVGVEYRAMGFLAQPSAELGEEAGEAPEWIGGKPAERDPFGWLAQRQRGKAVRERTE